MNRDWRYTRELSTAHNSLEATRNLVQIIINKIEAGDIDSALLTAVELRQALTLPNKELSRQLSDTLTETARLIQHTQALQAARESKAHRAGYVSGKRITLISLGFDPDDGDYTGLGVDFPTDAADENSQS